MTNEEYKVIRVSLLTYGYLMNNKTLDRKTMDLVVGGLIEDKAKLEAKIKALEDEIGERRDYSEFLESTDGQTFKMSNVTKIIGE